MLYEVITHRVQILLNERARTLLVLLLRRHGEHAGEHGLEAHRLAHHHPVHPGRQRTQQREAELV